jgi:hypothetical protein
MGKKFLNKMQARARVCVFVFVCVCVCVCVCVWMNHSLLLCNAVLLF